MNKGWHLIRIMPNKKCETMRAKKKPDNILVHKSQQDAQVT